MIATNKKSLVNKYAKTTAPPTLDPRQTQPLPKQSTTTKQQTLLPSQDVPPIT